MTLSPPRLWLLTLNFASRIAPGIVGALLSGGTIFFVLIGAFFLAGVFAGEHERGGAAIFFAAIVGYMVPVFDAILQRARICRDELLHLLADPDASHRAILTSDFRRKSFRWQLTVTLAGCIAGVAHHMMVLLSTGARIHEIGSAVGAAMAFGTILVWVTMTFVLATLFTCASVFRELAGVVRIDLLRAGALKPFAQVAAAFALALIGAQAALPLMLIDGFSVAGFLPGWIAMLLPTVGLIVITVVPIHQRILEEKTIVLGRIDAAIEQARVGSGDDVAVQAKTLGPLLNYRREISSVQEWSFDIGVTARLAFYLLIPPLTWIAAALIEILVDRFVM